MSFRISLILALVMQQLLVTTCLGGLCAPETRVQESCCALEDLPDCCCTDAEMCECSSDVSLPPPIVGLTAFDGAPFLSLPSGYVIDVRASAAPLEAAHYVDVLHVPSALQRRAMLCCWIN